MATTSTVPAFIDALLAAMRTALPGVQVEAAWPGPDVTENETVFIGDSVTEWTSNIASVKVGRQQRAEGYTIEVECWVAQPGALRAASAGQARTRAVQIIDTVDSLLANTPKLIESIIFAEVSDRAATLVPFGAGWSCQATASIRVEARLV